jgi:hypothetical protein
MNRSGVICFGVICSSLPRPQILAETSMTEEHKHAILFATTLLSARKIIEVIDNDEPQNMGRKFWMDQFVSKAIHRTHKTGREGGASPICFGVFTWVGFAGFTCWTSLLLRAIVGGRARCGEQGMRSTRRLRRMAGKSFALSIISPATHRGCGDGKNLQYITAHPIIVEGAGTNKAGYLRVRCTLESDSRPVG